MQQKAAVSDLRADLVYKKVGDTEVTMDLMLPKTTRGPDGKALFPEGTPVVFYLHGGGWRNGSRYNSPFEAKFFSDNGIALACVTYRMLGESNTTIGTCVIDCFDAARYLAKHAGQYGLDPNRFFAYGHSAGGHLSLMMALADPAAFAGDPALAGEKFRFAGAVPCAGPTTFLDVDAWGKNRWLAVPEKCQGAFGGNFEETRDLRERCSPVFWLKKGVPPLVVVHAQDDAVVGIAGSDLFVKKAKELGVEVRYVRVESGGHRLPQVSGDPAVSRQRFVLEALKQLAQQDAAKSRPLADKPQS